MRLGTSGEGIILATALDQTDNQLGGVLVMYGGI